MTKEKPLDIYLGLLGDRASTRRQSCTLKMVLKRLFISDTGKDTAMFTGQVSWETDLLKWVCQPYKDLFWTIFTLGMNGGLERLTFIHF